MQIISKYTIPLVLSNDFYVLFNTRSSGMIRVSKEEYAAIENQGGNLDKVKDVLRTEVIDAMKENKMIVDAHEDEDYLAHEILQHKMGSFVSRTLGLTIAPTCDCNFACPYCYETHKRKSYMGDEVIEQLAEFIEKYEACDAYSVTWYGGEPLMAFAQMKKIAERLKSIKGKKWNGHMIVSNTSLLNDEMIDFFKEYHLGSIQVSLDGAEEHHNQTRVFKSTKEGSFQLLLTNIEKILVNLPETDVAVRVNIDKSTAEDFGRVANMLTERFKDHLQRLHIYPGYIRVEDKERGCWSCQSIVSDDRFRFFEDMEKGFALPVNWIPNKAGKGCGATSLHSFIVGPEGDLYKCWNDFGDQNRCVGYLHNAGKPINERLLLRYLSMGTGLDDEACKVCAMLPVCDTGCAWERVANRFEDKHFDVCTMAKDRTVLAQCMANYLKHQD